MLTRWLTQEGFQLYQIQGFTMISTHFGYLIGMTRNRGRCGVTQSAKDPTMFIGSL